MNCPKCGNEINDNQKFCSKCGANLTDDKNYLEKFRDSDSLFYPLIIGAIIVILLLVGIGYAMHSNFHKETATTNTETLAEDTEEKEEPSTNFDPEIARRALEEKNGNEEQIINQAQEYAYMFDYEHNKIPINFNPRKCLFNVKGVCFGHPFYVSGMSYMDCKANKDSLEINSCFDSNDIYASTAYVCGGTKYMPTPDELVLLAQDLYNNANINNLIDGEYKYCVWSSDTWDISSCKEQNAQKGQRNNYKPYLEYFRDVDWSNKNFKSAHDEKIRRELGIGILSNRLSPKNNNYIIKRFFFNNATGLATNSRNNGVNIHNITHYSICVQRDRNYVTPKTQKFPIKEINNDEVRSHEAENELF